MAEVFGLPVEGMEALCDHLNVPVIRNQSRAYVLLPAFRIAMYAVSRCPTGSGLVLDEPPPPGCHPAVAPSRMRRDGDRLLLELIAISRMDGSALSDETVSAGREAMRRMVEAGLSRPMNRALNDLLRQGATILHETDCRNPVSGGPVM